MSEKDLNDLSQQIIGAAIEVHRQLGPGLLEQVYQEALILELRLRKLNVESEVSLPARYKGTILPTSYRLDIIVENEIILELKATEKDSPIYPKQLLTYLRLSGKKLGLLINFNHERLINGITRVVNNL